jgi:choline-sulfatase
MLSSFDCKQRMRSVAVTSAARMVCSFLMALFLAPQCCDRAQALAADSGSGANVLLITVDTLRADHLGCYGYQRIKTPNIDALAVDGVQFNRAYAQVPLTLPSHAVILTGTYPMYNTVRDFTGVGLPPSVGILSEAFERHGYVTAAFVSSLVLDGFWGLRRGFQTYDSVVNAETFESGTRQSPDRIAKETVDRFLRWFDSRPTAKPFLAWLHLYDPHSPYRPPEPYFSQYFGHLYDGEIAYCDDQIGRVFTALKRTGLYDGTLIIFLSDHGESLGEHGEDEHGLFLYSATLRVPLIVKAPRGVVPGRRKVDAVVSTIDISPTVLQLVRFTDSLTKQFQGNSLASFLNDPDWRDDRIAYAETFYPKNSFGWSPLRALIGARHYYIDAPRPELYDMAKDPGQTVDLRAERGAETNVFKARLNHFVRQYTAKATPPPGTPVPADTLEKLRSLGYLAYKAPATTGDAVNLPDPKDKIKTHRVILRATVLSEAGRFAESDRLLRELAPAEPKLYAIPFILGENAFRQGRLKEAQRQFLACLNLSPAFSPALIGAARAYHADHQNERVKPLLQLALQQNPHNFLASYALGVVASEEKNYVQATSYFQAAVRDRPNFAQAYEGLGIAQAETHAYRDALSNLERARTLGAFNAVLLNYQAFALSNLGNPRKAVEFYLRALELKPDYALARLNLAMAYRELGERENALRQFGKLCDSYTNLCEQFRGSFQ